MSASERAAIMIRVGSRSPRTGDPRAGEACQFLYSIVCDFFFRPVFAPPRGLTLCMALCGFGIDCACRIPAGSHARGDDSEFLFWHGACISNIHANANR